PKLAQALRDQGTFAAVEATVRQIYRQQEQSKIEGGWHNSVTLSQLGWTEEMIRNARAWATSRGLIRKNEIHQLEEFKIPTSSTYSWEETKCKESIGKVEMDVEDPDGSILDFGEITAESALQSFG
ncbi:Uncharacterized protein SCF082_LOCUS7597, partial [Durusdinium trenchii]